jgi:ankyrin repeat protein
MIRQRVRTHPIASDHRAACARHAVVAVAATVLLSAALQSEIVHATEASDALPALARVELAKPDPERTITPPDPARRPGDSITDFGPRRDSDARQALLAAARSDDIDALRKLLAAGTNPNVASADGDRPLSIAVERQQLETVRLLLLAGARADFRAANGMTPLGSAILLDDLPAVEALLRAGADPEVRSANRNTALNDAVALSRTAIALRLMRAGADLEAPDRLGRRVLGGAAASGDLVVLEAALAAGVDPDQRDRNDRPPVYWANVMVHTEIMALLESAAQRQRARADAWRSAAP